MKREIDENQKVIPLFGKDEMNLIEFPFGPVTATTTKTLEIEHQAWDKSLQREVTRRMVITGSDAFGLPRPIDDQVLIGMKTLTHEAGYASRRVEFSRYHLCRTIGWSTDGRAYARLEQSFDRIAGTTLKFKDAWWDKGEREWKSKTFHLIDEADLCSKDRLDRARSATGRNAQALCSFVWNEVVWKSFQDGFIRTLDMTLFRKIASGRRREVPLRLFRILDKRFHFGEVAKFDLHRLCIGTLGLSPGYSPSQMARVLDRAAKRLIECGYLDSFRYDAARGGKGVAVLFRKRTAPRVPQGRGRQRRQATGQDLIDPRPEASEDALKIWLRERSEAGLAALEAEAIREGFGSELERRIVVAERARGVAIGQAGRIRQEYVRRYSELRAPLTDLSAALPSRATR